MTQWFGLALAGITATLVPSWMSGGKDLSLGAGVLGAVLVIGVNALFFYGTSKLLEFQDATFLRALQLSAVVQGTTTSSSPSPS